MTAINKPTRECCGPWGGRYWRLIGTRLCDRQGTTMCSTFARMCTSALPSAKTSRSRPVHHCHDGVLEYWSTVQRTTCAYSQRTQPLPIGGALAGGSCGRVRWPPLKRAPSACAFLRSQRHGNGIGCMRLPRRGRPCGLARHAVRLASHSCHGITGGVWIRLWLVRGFKLSTRSTRTSSVRLAAYQVSASDVYGTQHPPGCYQARLCSHSHHGTCCMSCFALHAAHRWCVVYLRACRCICLACRALTAAVAVGLASHGSRPPRWCMPLR